MFCVHAPHEKFMPKLSWICKTSSRNVDVKLSVPHFQALEVKQSFIGFLIKEVFSKYAANLQKNTLAEIPLRHWCSPVNLLHIFRTPFPKNTSGGLLLRLTCKLGSSNVASLFLFYSHCIWKYSSELDLLDPHPHSYGWSKCQLENFFFHHSIPRTVHDLLQD